MALCGRNAGSAISSKPKQLPRVLSLPARRRPGSIVTQAGWRLDGAMDKQMADHYATLMVPRGAGDAAIKEAYRRLQRRYHPDNSSQGDAARSSDINEAYRTLMDRGARAKYDAELRRNGPPPSPMRDIQGLVGPVVSSGVLLAEALPECGAGACDVDGRAEMEQFVRQWGATLTWSAELPLPMPLQFDEVAGGCRLGFVTVRDGAVALVGELRFTVVPAEEAAGGALAREAAGSPWLVAVRRQGSSGPLPGEQRILRSFRAVCSHHRTPPPAERRVQLSGLLAAALSGAIGGLPFMGSSDSRTYERYHLKRAPAPAAGPDAAARSSVK